MKALFGTKDNTIRPHHFWFEILVIYLYQSVRPANAGLSDFFWCLYTTTLHYILLIYYYFTYFTLYQKKKLLQNPLKETNQYSPM
ncbi:hypothetical protein Y032_0003g1496 [Ancylostoma ceylanicum]|uniref:Uncharacterized protein n=1 Tax=Ancylostoma ceylanicum TaxID=53326 RepID=A0A016VXY9_9BILA|nr:hypothetical protein Y032_0003g1496 [Ancylostoma ceylanicum]